MGARRYWPIWAPVGPLALWAMVRAFGLESGGLLVTAMLFTPLAAIAALLVSGVAAALRNWAAAFVAALATVSLAVAVLPRGIGDGAAEAAGHQTLTVLSANVYLGRANEAALMALVDRYRPDVLSLQELTPYFARRLRRAGIGRRLPYSALEMRPRGHGGGLYARRPLSPPSEPGDFLFRMPRATLTLAGGRRLRLVAVHPQPPNMSFDAWESALRSLPVPRPGAPWVLAGDFNATLDQVAFRELVDAGYRDAAAQTGQGLEPTFLVGPDDLALGLIAIDHVLADDRLGIASYGVDDLPGSDHRAIHARLVLP